MYKWCLDIFFVTGCPGKKSCFLMASGQFASSIKNTYFSYKIQKMAEAFTNLGRDIYTIKKAISAKPKQSSCENCAGIYDEGKVAS